MFIIFHYWKYFQQNTKGLLVSLISPIVLGKFILDTFWSEKIWTGFETENNVKIFELLSWALFCLVELYRCKTLRCLSLGIEKEQAIKCSEIFIKKKKKFLLFCLVLTTVSHSNYMHLHRVHIIVILNWHYYMVNEKLQ